MITPDAVTALQAWFEAEEPLTFAVLSSDDLIQARSLLGSCHITTLHITVPTLSDLHSTFEGCIQGAIERLIHIPFLTVGDELQHVLDQGLYQPKLGQLFESLWTARFDMSEGRSNVVDSIGKLMEATFDDDPAFVNDAILLWLTLCRHNFPERGRLLMVYHPMPSRAPAQEFLLTASNWASLGSPVKALVSRG